MFELLKEKYVASMEAKKHDEKFFIINGYMPTWAEEYRNDPEKGLKRFSTDTRYEQYINGIITRDKAIEYAVKRNNKKIDKEIENKLFYIDMIAGVPDISFIRVEVDWKRSSVWGYNPHAEVTTNAFYYRAAGSASGCGYDKRSAAVAEAFNDHQGITKVLFTLAEESIKKGLPYREGIGYGSGYSIIPYFEGGVGVECFWSILKKAGFECISEGGKTWDIYRLEKRI